MLSGSVALFNGSHFVLYYRDCQRSVSIVIAMIVPIGDSNDDEVKEVDAPSGYERKEKKSRLRVP